MALDITGVSLPNLSVKTTPNWYSLNDFIDLLDSVCEFGKSLHSVSKDGEKCLLVLVKRL